MDFEEIDNEFEETEEIEIKEQSQDINADADADADADIYKCPAGNCTKLVMPGKTLCKRHLDELSGVVVREVFEKNINGIVYYTDRENRLFSISDIIKRVSNPAIVGRWNMDEEGRLQIKLY
jgi:hypothetical protein